MIRTAVARPPLRLLGQPIEETERRHRLEDRRPHRVEVDRARHHRQVHLVGGELGRRQRRRRAAPACPRRAAATGTGRPGWSGHTALRRLRRRPGVLDRGVGRRAGRAAGRPRAAPTPPASAGTVTVRSAASETDALLQRRARRVPHPGQRRAAERARPGAGRLDRPGPGAGRPGGPRPRGALRRRGPVPHRRLVHHRVPGRARPSPGARTGATTLKSVKEQLRAVPRRGLGYGALRYLAPGTPAAPARRPGAAGQLQLPRPVRRRAGDATTGSTAPPCPPAGPGRRPGRARDAPARRGRRGRRTAGWS